MGLRIRSTGLFQKNYPKAENRRFIKEGFDPHTFLFYKGSMMGKCLKTVVVLLIFSLGCPQLSSAGQITLSELTAQLGIQPDMIELKTVSKGGSLTARINDASKFKQIGFEKAEKGGKVRLTSMGDSMWRIDCLSTRSSVKIRVTRNVNPATAPRIKIVPVHQ